MIMVLEKINELKKPTELKYLFLTSFLVGGVILAPILSNRILDMYSMKLTLGALLVTAMFGLIDVINNDYGIAKAKQSIFIFTVTKICFAFIIAGLLLLPYFKETPGFMNIIQSAFRVEVASLCSMFVSQYFIDVKIFDYFKQKFNSFFVRYTLSNLSQVVGLLIFVIIGFYGTGLNLLQLFVGHLVLRFGIQFLLTPMYSVLIYKPQIATQE